MSKWDWKKVESYNNKQKVFVLITGLLIAFALRAPYDGWEDYPIFILLCIGAIYLFKD